MATEFAQFMAENPTVFHFARGVCEMLDRAGFVEIFETDLPKLERGHKYYVNRNDSNVVAFEIGADFVCGSDGFVITATHMDANRLSLKPTSLAPSVQSYERIGVAPYGGGILESWFDRDLGLGGRVLIKTPHGVSWRLVKLPGTIGTIPRLAPHFGNLANPNWETNFVPIVGTFGPDPNFEELEASDRISSGRGECAKRHSLALVDAIARQLQCSPQNILDMELEFFSSELPTIGGLQNDLLMCSRMDDRLCSYTAVQGFINSSKNANHAVKMVALYDNEEIGSLTRTGGNNKLMESIMGVIHQSLGATRDERLQSAANSLVISADVTHAVNPNYLSMYAESHMPRLNTGMTIKQLGRFTSQGVDAAICQLVAEKSGVPLQRFSPRNDTRSGGTIGPMRAASLGIRTIDVGIPVLAMHSIREVTGTQDIPLGIKWFKTYYEMANDIVIYGVNSDNR